MNKKCYGIDNEKKKKGTLETKNIKDENEEKEKAKATSRR